MEEGQSARGGKAILLGRPQGVVTSHGTISAYQGRRVRVPGGGDWDTHLSLQRLRAKVSSRTLQPTLLPRAGMFERVASLAGRQAAAETSSGPRRAPTACRSGTAAAQTQGVPSRRAAGRATSSEPKYRVPPPPSLRAWSRSKEAPQNFCDRSGCYEPVRESPRASASYCSDACRAAMAAIRDRDRKWLRGNSLKGREERQHEYKAAKRKRCRGRVLADAREGRLPWVPRVDFGPRLSSKRSLAARLPHSWEVNCHDSQANPGSRPRAPPAAGGLVVD